MSVSVPPDALELDRRIRWILGVRRGETIEQAALRIVRSENGGDERYPRPTIDAAREVLASGPPWERIRAAVEVARPGLIPPNTSPAAPGPDGGSPPPPEARSRRT